MNADNENNKIKENVEMLSKDMAKDILSTAIESGIAYWMNEDSENVSLKRDTDLEYKSISFDLEKKHYEITPASLIKVAKEFAEKYPHLPVDDNYDACSADALFQYAAFNEIIYG